MLTKNYYRTLAKCTVMGYGTVNYIGINGNTFTNGGYVATIQFGYDSASSAGNEARLKSLQTGTNTNGGVILGTGTTAPSFDDISLSGSVISNFTYTSTVTNEVDENGMTLTANYTITNTGEEAFTIGEIGIIANLSGTAKTSSNKALLERTVLDEPVTIEAGGVGQVTYTIQLNYPVS